MEKRSRVLALVAVVAPPRFGLITPLCPLSLFVYIRAWRTGTKGLPRPPVRPRPRLRHPPGRCAVRSGQSRALMRREGSSKPDPPKARAHRSKGRAKRRRLRTTLTSSKLQKNTLLMCNNSQARPQTEPCLASSRSPEFSSPPDWTSLSGTPLVVHPPRRHKQKKRNCSHV